MSNFQDRSLTSSPDSYRIDIQRSIFDIKSPKLVTFLFRGTGVYPAGFTRNFHRATTLLSKFKPDFPQMRRLYNRRKATVIWLCIIQT